MLKPQRKPGIGEQVLLFETADLKPVEVPVSLAFETKQEVTTKPDLDKEKTRKDLESFKKALKIIKETVDDFFDNDRSGDITRLVTKKGQGLVAACRELVSRYQEKTNQFRDIEDAINQGDHGSVYKIADEIILFFENKLA